MDNFADNITEMLCTNPEQMAKRLATHAATAGKSFKELVSNLHDRKPFGSAINFYMAAAREYIGEPVFVVVPKHNRQKSTVTNPPKYIFERKFFFEEDSYIGHTNIKLRFIFNGVNFYAPFFQKDAAKIIRSGTPLLKSIKQSYSDLQRLLPKIPKESSINVGMKFLDIHMKAAYDIVVNMSFNSGSSYVSENYTQSIPAIDPLLPARIRRRKCDKRLANPTGEESPAKRQKEDQGNKKKLPERQGIPALTRMAVDALTASGVVPASPPPGSPPSTSTSEVATTASQVSSTTASQVSTTASQVSITASQVSTTASQVSTTTSQVTSSQNTPFMFAATDCRPNQCSCGIEFPSFEGLALHKGSVHAGGSIQCSGYWRKRSGLERCKYTSKDPGTVWKHYRTQHCGLFLNYCTESGCSGYFNGGKYGSDSLGAVKKHMDDVHGIRSDLRCPRCDYLAGEKYKLRRHIQKCEAQNKNVKFLTCEKCGKKFRDDDTFSLHKRQDHPKIPGDTSAFYYCELCGKRYRNYGGRKKHMKKEHDA